MPVAFYAACFPWSFTLNALVRQFTRTPPQPDICAFGGEIRILPLRRADPLSANCRAAKISKNLFCFCRHAMRKNDFSHA
jgi:hypothetical protein